MENKESNGLLLKVLQRVCLHFNVAGAENISFKKRSAFLERLKEVNEEAWQTVSQLIDTQLQINRLMADKEKQQKNAAVWEAELGLAQKKKTEAGLLMTKLFQTHTISTEGLPEGF